jgi:altronate hydrolase
MKSNLAPPLQTSIIQLNALDDIAIALHDLPMGAVVAFSDRSIAVLNPVPSGHKLALVDIEKGQPVRRYGQVIGFARQDIRAGEHVHVHNLGVDALDSQPSLVSDTESIPVLPLLERRTFQGFHRVRGRAGTRNYIAVISTVNCSAHVTQAIAHHFTPEKLAPYPNIDGVISLTHPYGCGVDIGGKNYALLQRTLAGMATHPNVAASLLVGLGCETNQALDLIRNYGLDQAGGYDLQPLVIQDLGGTASTIAAGIAAVESLLPLANHHERTTCPVSELALALQCGGSDGWSGVTANPVVGLVADVIVKQGGTVLLAETPEIYGAEHLLTSRAADQQVADRLLAQVGWWEEHTQRLGTALDTNRSPGNAAGGLTTIYEKALGAVAKGGSTPLNAVYEYAQPVINSGLAFMNSPGNDAISVTGQVAGGCNLVLFTTGRGSAFGFKPAPSLKISTNTTLYQRMSDDIDLNAGKILEGARMEEVAAKLFEQVLAVASGQRTKSEALGIGEAEFSPWFLGGVL